MASPARDPRDRRPRGHGHQPRQGLLPAAPATPSWISCGTTSRSRTARSRRPGPADGPQALRQRRREASRSSRSAPPTTRPTGSRPSTLTFPSGRTADEVVVATPPGSPGSSTSAASTSIPTRSAPRTSTTPTSCASTSTRCPACPGRRSARWRWSCREALGGLGLVGLAEDVRARAASTSTCGSSRGGRTPRCGGRRWRWRARSSGARPTLATRKWWKEERHGVFLDYNQNAKDRTVASAYSVRPTPDARVSMPLRWDEVAGRRAGGLHARDGAGASTPRAATRGPASTTPSGSLEALLELSARHEAEGRATRRGRRTTPSRRASRRASQPSRKRPRRRRVRGPRRGRRPAREEAAGAGAAMGAGDPKRAWRPRLGAARGRRRPGGAARDPRDRDRPRRDEGRGAGRPRALEGPPPGGGRALEPADVLDGLDARPLHDWTASAST